MHILSLANKLPCILVRKEILLNPQFLFMAGICYYHLQNQSTKVTENKGSIIITELMVHGTAIKFTVMLGGGTMPGSQLL